MVSKSNDDISTIIENLIKEHKIPIIKLSELNVSQKIGEGGQAKVYSGKFKGVPVALKIISEIDIKCLTSEIIIMSKLNHPNIPKFYGLIYESDSKRIGMVIQLIQGCSLHELPDNELDTKEKVKIMKSIGSALEYIHSLNFIHRDLKPENILIEDVTKDVFLIDFGIAKVANELKISTRAKGTINYISPEIFDIESKNEKNEIISSVTTKVDVWSYGCIISWLFSGYVPWSNKYKDNPAIIQSVLTKKKDFPIPENISDKTIKTIISKCMVIKPENRSSMEELKELISNCKC